MKIKLLKIQTTNIPQVFKIEIKAGNQSLTFDVTVEVDTVAGQTILITHGSQEFCDFFRFNQDLASQICQLVCSFYNSIPINLPTDIGEFSALRPLEIVEYLVR
ncbi:hypothetical protein [Gloeothece verrucosa]|uniref:Uncharacterized protein n=1 Tax=Gloeothece verrucosa (strain PCC 7822) TaxID=497965 RepID=E0UM65_GLOV7|nr:hypothetical protein [Gloeothece verrucosa]ADN18045.1 hypothetical protein Cyan7822_6244 [Gloeothece verrucosa PCC 7822]